MQNHTTNKENDDTEEMLGSYDGKKKSFVTPKLTFVEPKLTKHGEVVKITQQSFFGIFSP